MVLQEIIIIVVLLISVSALLCMLLSSVNSVGVVKAGNVDDFQWIIQLMGEDKPEVIECNGQAISTDGLELRAIRGESMHLYKIHDNYRGLIHIFTEEEKTSINGMPIVEFKIHERPLAIWESHRKLRKFIAYLPLQESYDFHKIYDTYKAYISIEEDLFVSECEERMVEIRRAWKSYKKDKVLVLSETYDCEKQRNHYSLHRASSLYGRLDYYYDPKKNEEIAA